MTHAIRVHATGGPEVLQWEPVEIGEPGPGQTRIRHTAIGLNFIEVYHRVGFYPIPTSFTPGQEGAGVVEAVGPGVTHVKVGDRVAYGGTIGSYSERRLIAADKLLVLPDAIDDRSAAALTSKGLTAAVLLRRGFKVAAGHTVLFHAAAGGVGAIACQWAAALGATVIGTVGSDEKAVFARAHGCHHAVNYRSEDFVARVNEITGGKGVDVVYDSVGKDTFPRSLECMKPFGFWIGYGQSSGRPPPFDMTLLQKRWLYVGRQALQPHIATRAGLEALAGDLFAAITAGQVRAAIGQEFPLAKVADAHRALESRGTTGSSLLIHEPSSVMFADTWQRFGRRLHHAQPMDYAVVNKQNEYRDRDVWRRK